MPTFTYGGFYVIDPLGQTVELIEWDSQPKIDKFTTVYKYEENFTEVKKQYIWRGKLQLCEDDGYPIIREYV